MLSFLCLVDNKTNKTTTNLCLLFVFGGWGGSGGMQSFYGNLQPPREALIKHCLNLC